MINVQFFDKRDKNMEFLIIGAITGIILAIFYLKGKKKASNSLLADKRFKNAKIFKVIKTPIAISEDGYIGIVDVFLPPTIIHIKDVNGFELIVDSQKVADVDATVTDHWLFRDMKTITTTTSQREEIHNMTLLFKMNDFNNPTLKIPLIIGTTKKGSMYYNMIQDNINEILSTLEIVEKKYKDKSSATPDRESYTTERQYDQLEKLIPGGNREKPS
jgi:hypothetical protein